jgi:hypothetical protein
MVRDGVAVEFLTPDTSVSEGAGGGGAPTEAVESPTVEAQQVHAWELDDDDDGFQIIGRSEVVDILNVTPDGGIVERATWAQVWPRARVCAFGGAMVGLILMALATWAGVDWTVRSGTQPATSTPIPASAAATPTTPSATPAAAPLPPSTVTVTPPSPAPSVTVQAAPPSPSAAPTPPPQWELDGAFINRLLADGFPVVNPAAAITAAHLICQAIAQDGNADGIIPAILKHNPTMSAGQAQVWVLAAGDTYCPQYDAQIRGATSG